MSQNKNESSTEQWTNVQAYTLAVVCLLLGIAGGWLIRGSQAREPQAGVSNVAVAAQKREVQARRRSLPQTR